MLEQLFLVLKIFVVNFCPFFCILKFAFWKKKSLIWQIALFSLCQSPLLLPIIIYSITHSLQNALQAMYISTLNEK
jgi:hypothetical protein